MSQEIVPYSPTDETVAASSLSMVSNTHHQAAGGAIVEFDDVQFEEADVPEQAPPQNNRDDVESPSTEKVFKSYKDTGVVQSPPPPGFMVVRKWALGLMVFLLLAFMALFGYFFAEWWKLEKADVSKNAVREIPTTNDPTDIEKCITEEEIPCEFTAEDIDALELTIGDLEAALANLTAQHEDLMDDHANCGDDNGDLSDEIDRLEAEIDRLEAANGQLADQLDDYEAINDRLNNSIQELKLQNQILSDSNDVYEGLNNRLNASLAELQEQNEALAEQVEIYEGLNQDLNATVAELGGHVDRLVDEVDELTTQNDRLEGLVGSLNNETDRLWELGEALQDNVDRLEGRVAELSTENDRLEGLVSDLETVASFLDETSQNLDETYDEFVGFLAEQITTNRVLVLEALQNTYHIRVAGWDCSLRDHFALESFANNGNIPIPQDKYDEVMLFVEERVLSDLCLDTSDFTTYLEDRYGSPQDITTNRLVTGVQRYTFDALDYYFPETGEVGLTPEDWANAAYECGQLPEDKKFGLA